MKILYSGYKDPGHSKFGGYDKIAQYDKSANSKNLVVEDYWLGDHFGSHIMRIPFTLLDLHTRWLRWKYDITHLYYGEITMLGCLPYLKSKKHKTVITLHLDIEKRRLPKLFVWILRHFDGIIVLSSQQQAYLRDKYNLNSSFIPHGFIKPLYDEKMPIDVNGTKFEKEFINIVVIGQNYRDFVTLKKIIDYSRKYSNIVYLVGIPRSEKDKLYGQENVRIYPRLNNDEFYTILSNCDYNFLPLTFATANNTLLEAQFLDVTSILPRIAGIEDYAAPEPYNLYYDSFESLKRIVDKLKKNNPDGCLSDFAEQFSWENIYDKLTTFYTSL